MEHIEEEITWDLGEAGEDVEEFDVLIDMAY